MSTIYSYYCFDCDETFEASHRSNPHGICSNCGSSEVILAGDKADDYIPSALYYDDNFGYYDNTDDPDVREFYRSNQAKSVEKECLGCGRSVKILPHYAYCNRCADLIENGLDI